MQLPLPLPGVGAAVGGPEPLPRSQRIYCNRNLRLDQVTHVGFDMDYTLAIYNQPEMDRLSIEVTARKLIYMGVRRIGVLSQIPQPLLLREFGKYGAYLWERANGIDPSPIIPYRDEKSLSRERTFQTDTIDLHFLRAQLADMTGKLAFALRQAGKLTSCVTVKIRYTDFQTYTRQRTIDHTAGDRVLIRLVLELFEQLYTRRLLVRLVGVKFSGVVRGHLQISLLDDTPRELNLLAALDRIRHRFGPDAIRWG